MTPGRSACVRVAAMGRGTDAGARLAMRFAQRERVQALATIDGWTRPRARRSRVLQFCDANGVAAQVVSRSQLGATALSSWPKCS
jgi:hypothetical protein